MQQDIKNRRRRIESISKLTKQQDTIMIMKEQDKSLPPLPKNKTNDNNILEMNSNVNKSSISLNTPMKSSPVVSTTPTNVKSSDNYSITKSISRETEIETETETESLPSNEEINRIDSEDNSVMGSIFKNITGYNDNTNINNLHQRTSSLNDESIAISTNYELGDGIKFGNENGNQMLSYRKSRGKSNKPKIINESIDKNDGINHKKNNSISINSIINKNDNSPNETNSIGTGITPITLTSPKIEVDYNLYVDEKYLDTQYRYATDKRNFEFHQLFSNIPEVDRLLDDFSCALSREILLQGRIYISEHYLCFNSSLLGWVTTLIISLDEIQKFERKSTVGLFPNGIIIETKEAKHTFANFITRDQTLNFIETIWSKSISLSKKNHEKSRDFESIESKTSFDNINENNNVKLLTEDDIYTIDDDDDEGEEDSSSDESHDDDDDDDDGEYDTEGSNSNTVEEITSIKSIGKSINSIKDKKNKKKKNNSNSNNKFLFPGPKIHSPSNYSINSKDTTIVLDEEFEIPIGLLYEIFFGKDLTFHKNMMIMNDGINFTNYSTFSGEGSERNFEYDKKLNFPIGPSSTRVYCTEKLIHFDVNDYIEILNISKTPNVPSGNSFDCRTKYSIIWGKENRSRLIISFKLEWTGSSWFKSVIESSALSGQSKAANDVKDELLKIIPQKIIEFNLNDNENENENANVIEMDNNKVEKENKPVEKENKAVDLSTSDTNTTTTTPISKDQYFISNQKIQLFGNLSLSNVITILFFLVIIELFILTKLLSDNIKLTRMIENQSRSIFNLNKKINEINK
ncbi:hypothetical protein C6P40_004022 [Pichia californica]|uniref:VASt domain-containing protein n=1 Tax=Pichia californica TaxID=460514 RepID=A0A9P6WQG3_9ASCO|nr:hypothetical protein C6P40_004022 [[Candida] californica]